MVPLEVDVYELMRDHSIISDWHYLLPKDGGNMTTVPCCPRTRPHTNSFYCFSRDEATLQEGVAVCLSAMLLERVCNTFVF